ncbi:MAG: ferrochelatase [Calditrichaeota bacterium]|nr:ferrochelatase [Calditrichota bacterium]
MSRNQHKVTVILVNMGGPETLEEIKPFLLNLFNDPDIIDIPGGRLFRPLLARWIVYRRLPEVTENFKQIGGGSPLLKISQEQADALRDALAAEFDEVDVRLAMRYSKPFSEEAIQGIPPDHRIVVLPLYPQFSTTTTGSSFKELFRVASQNGHNPDRFIWIRDYHDHPLFIDAWVRLIQETMDTMPEEFRHRAPILFSAHGVPVSVIERGDPYEEQIKRGVERICQQLGVPNPVHITYQSKVGRAQWLEPSTEEMLEQLGHAGEKAVIVVPISFVSEHSETLYELDIMLKDIARDAGIEHYYRVPTFNARKEYIQTLKQVVMDHVQ